MVKKQVVPGESLCGPKALLNFEGCCFLASMFSGVKNLADLFGRSENEKLTLNSSFAISCCYHCIAVCVMTQLEKVLRLDFHLKVSTTEESGTFEKDFFVFFFPFNPFVLHLLICSLSFVSCLFSAASELPTCPPALSLLLLFLSYFICSHSIAVLFSTRWLPLPLCGCWLTAVWDCAGLKLGFSHSLLPSLALALYCVCLNVFIVTLYSTHLLYCTSLRGTFTHPSSFCLLFLRLRASDGKVEGRGQRAVNKSATVAMIDREVALHRRND